MEEATACAQLRGRKANGFVRRVERPVCWSIGRDDKQQAGLRITALQSWREPAELTPCTDVRTEQQREGVGF